MVATTIKSEMNLAAQSHDDLGGKIGASSMRPIVAQILYRTSPFSTGTVLNVIIRHYTNYGPPGQLVLTPVGVEISFSRNSRK